MGCIIWKCFIVGVRTPQLLRCFRPKTHTHTHTRVQRKFAPNRRFEIILVLQWTFKELYVSMPWCKSHIKIHTSGVFLLVHNRIHHNMSKMTLACMLSSYIRRTVCELYLSRIPVSKKSNFNITENYYLFNRYVMGKYIYTCITHLCV